MISLAAATVGNSAGERIVFGLLVSVIGISVVFILLAILIYVLKLFEYIAKIKVKNKKSKKINKAEKSEEIIPSTTVSEITVDNGINYDETVAAIVGALSVVLSEGAAVENPDAKFVVRSIKKFNPRRF